MEKKSLEYLEKYFVDSSKLAALSDVSEEFLETALETQAIPGPSYIVRSQISIDSHIFGSSDSIVEEKKYFHRSVLSWVNNLKLLLEEVNLEEAAERVKMTLEEEYSNFLSINTDKSTEEIKSSWENTWTHFLKGTYGVCVINPVDGVNIAKKQNAAAKLREFTENGERVLESQEEQKSTFN